MMQTMCLPKGFVLAPDHSEIRPLLNLARGGMAHCTLPPAGVSLAVRHRTIEEIWYFIEGRGEVWRKQGARQELVGAMPGTCVTIPRGAHFQFRNTGEGPLVFLIATMPPWPGEREAARVPDHWPVDDEG